MSRLNPGCLGRNRKQALLPERPFKAPRSNDNSAVHKFLNDVVPFNPTAENIAKWVCEQIPNCYRVSVQESEGNVATYERD